MAFRRGFKSEANAIAAEVRAELGLRALDPLDPLALAAHLEVPVLPLTDYEADAPSAQSHFAGAGMEAFSAVTVFRGPRRTIVHNDSHSPGGRPATSPTNWTAPSCSPGHPGLGRPRLPALG